MDLRPWSGLAGAPLIAYRKSWFAEVGASQPPKTLEEYRKIGIALKKKGKPVGQTLGHTFGDAPAWSYPLVWGFGGAETDTSGKKVVLNSKATMDSVNWMVDFWKQACDESALAWDDTNNNRAFHAGEISATLNGASIYIFAKRNPEKIKDDKGEPMWRDIGHFGIPDGPLGRAPPYAVAFSHALMKYSKNPQAAKEFLKWLHGKDQFGKWFEIESGFSDRLLDAEKRQNAQKGPDARPRAPTKQMGPFQHPAQGWVPPRLSAPRSRGSSVSRRPSPRRFRLSPVTVRARPGNRLTQKASRITFLPLAITFPHEGT